MERPEGCQKLPRRVRERQERGHGEARGGQREAQRGLQSVSRGKGDTEETRKRPGRVPGEARDRKAGGGQEEVKGRPGRGKGETRKR